jgi:hypothetical protein
MINVLAQLPVDGGPGTCSLMLDISRLQLGRGAAQVVESIVAVNNFVLVSRGHHGWECFEFQNACVRVVARAERVLRHCWCGFQLRLPRKKGTFTLLQHG